MSDILTSDPGVERFRDAFQGKAFHLLEPVDPEVNYSFEVMSADPWTLEFRADKWWFAETGRIENSSVTLNTYPVEDNEAENEAIREEAMMEREAILRIYETQGLDAAMQKAQEIATANDLLESPYLFPEGPADRFVNQREAVSGFGKPSDELVADLETVNLADVIDSHKSWELDL